MIINNKRDLVYYEFELLKNEKINHGIFSRHGGVSPEPWNSLNIGSTVGDKQSNVIKNQKKIFEAIGRDVESVFDVWQVHGTNVAIGDKPRPFNSPHQKADIIITNNPYVTLLGKFADCVPIFLHDPIEKVICMVHAGWKGTVNKIASVAVETMKNKYGCKPGNILAGIGPSIGPEKYIIGDDVVSAVNKMPSNKMADFLICRNDKMYLDLWNLNSELLLDAGLKNVEISKICTATDNYNWFSHRKENGNTGRFGAVLAL